MRKRLLSYGTVRWTFWLIIAAFLNVFLVHNATGFESLWHVTRHSVLAAPDFVRDMVDYYASVPSDRWLKSMLVGAVFGAGSTLLVTFNRHKRLSTNVPSLPGVALAGAVAGAMGGQILMYPTQHCTYDPEIDNAQFRLGLVVTVLSALIMLTPLWSWLRRSVNERHERQTGHFKNAWLPYVLLLPTLASLLMFLYYPTVNVMLLSLKRKIFPLPNEQFSCMSNYISLTEDMVYRNSFATTLFITFFVVLFSLAISLGIAMLASQKIKGAGVYRTLLIWPFALSPVVTGVIFLVLFREGGTGMLSWFFDRTLGIQPHWLTDRHLAPWVIVTAAVWNLLGFNILFYIAGLQNVPQDLLEAAALDGAGRIARFWRVMFPLLSPFTFFLLVTNITYSFYGIYGAVETLTPQGGPRFGPGGESGATNVLIFKLYNDAFNTGAPAGFGAAQAVVLFLMVAGLTVFQFRYIERRVTYEG